MSYNVITLLTMENVYMENVYAATVHVPNHLTGE